ncbi:MAG: diadenylate cyclase CdaA [Kiritimatiellae bacterium]|nr:diadenylate cyclase CdaA [Kiritimatiellia bacterium]
MNLLDSIQFPGAEGVVEIIVLAVAFYYVLLFISGTRGAQVLTGLVLLLVFLTVLTQVVQLNTLNWILQRSPVYLAFAMLVIFQPEIRRVLEELGRRHRFTASNHQTAPFIEGMMHAVHRMSEQKIGCLIAVERTHDLTPYETTGVPLNSALSPELLINLFYPRTPLHDGGVIIRNGRIASAACVFPVSHKTDLSKALGTRHRAAIGLSEETDAVVLVVSEETGAMSVAFKGKLRRGLDEERVERLITSILTAPAKPGATTAPGWKWFSRFRRDQPSRAKPAPTGAGSTHGGI